MTDAIKRLPARGYPADAILSTLDPDTRTIGVIVTVVGGVLFAALMTSFSLMFVVVTTGLVSLGIALLYPAGLSFFTEFRMTPHREHHVHAMLPGLCQKI